MPTDTRYVRAATARRSPKARLYSAVPRSSQCPSIVTVQLGYFFRTAASASSAAWPAALTSALSSSKNNGLSGELRFRSSSEADAMASSRAGSGGTTVGSATGCGGAGGRVPGAVVVVGGGCGRAMGGFALWQASSVAVRTIRTKSAAREAASRVCIVYSMCPGPARRPAPTHDAGTLAGPFVLLRPVGFVVVPRFRDLPDVFAVAAHSENLILAGAVRRERQMPAVRRPARALVAALTKRQRVDAVGGHIEHLDVEARTRARRECDLVVGRRRPGRAIAIGLRNRQLVQAEAVGADHVQLWKAGAVRHEGDLRAARRPGARRVRGRVIREPPHVRTVTIRDVDFGIAVAIGHEAEARPIG